MSCDWQKASLVNYLRRQAVYIEDWLMRGDTQ